ncbi:MAG: ArnT family glycosyltransferase, partial [Planctomycetia bacterium]
MTVVGLAGLMALHFGLAADLAVRKTPTVDEVAHLPAGLSNLEKHTFRMYWHNPPLARMIAASASSTVDLKTHYDGTWKKHNPPSHWIFAFEFLLANADPPTARENYFAAFTRARLTIAAWSTLAIPLLYCWGAWWFGRPTGWLAATLYALDPTVLANAAFLTTDVPAAVMALAASFVFAGWVAKPTWGRAAAAGVLLGLAQLTKFSCLWLFFLWPAWAAAAWLLKQSPATLKQIVLHAALVVALAVLTIDAGYLFEGVGTPLGSFGFISNTLTRPRLYNDPPPPRPGSNRTINEVQAARINRFQTTVLGSLP